MHWNNCNCKIKNHVPTYVERRKERREGGRGEGEGKGGRKDEEGIIREGRKLLKHNLEILTSNMIFYAI